MKIRKFYTLILCLTVLVFSSFTSAAQDITGIWRGYFFTDLNDQYKFEIQIKQNTQKSISGVSYSYLTTVFYGKATLTGFFNKTGQTALIQEIKTVELRMTGGSVACIMKLFMNYTKSGKEEFLEGTYTSKYEKSDKKYGITKGESCGSGKVYLRKVVTSDFYVEPFLRNNPAIDKPNVATTKPPSASSTTKKPSTPPASKPVTKAPAKSTPQKGSTKPPVSKDVVVKSKPDTIKKNTPPIARQEAPKTEAPKPSMNIPTVTRSRQNELAQTITVKQKDLVIRIYDNGEIDDDTISIYLDNKMLLANQRLTASPITINLKMDEDNSEHTLVMVAENMGRFPPNTSLMIVQDGDKRYQVRITSTEQKNAMVRFKLED
ncbi:hypothetical protein OCK74_08360 [Chitinophagaceae bacterium LB-8]|uniref:DUF4488 domain-containing protein n=1 Tax=Paraflavisolibacter caeni TaxID=2982496 RepID=A0A9X3B7F0_9BACT|nr:hypothetical protein [Paraflavisolibacter caeni]MCU7549125.1 hypothetical protein [Paraflavisolibacter caeni]